MFMKNTILKCLSLTVKSQYRIELSKTSDQATMYGGMGGGGNAWMKIMGISSAEVSKRNAAKEKGKGGPGSGGVGGQGTTGSGQNALGDLG